MIRPAAFIFFFLATLPLFGESEELAFSFDRNGWNISLESFSGDLSDRYSYLKNSIPDLIKRELNQAETHILNAAEIKEYRKIIVSNEKKALLAKLKDAYEKKDQLLFSGDDGSASEEDLENTIAILREQLFIIDNIDHNSISTAQMLPVQWGVGDADGDLLTPDQYNPAVVCKTRDLDYLISGNLREVEGYFLMDVYGFDRSTGQENLIYEGTASLDLVEDLALDAADELRSIILGRAWAAVYIETDDPDSLIYSDGELIGVGSASINTLEPGSVLLEAIGIDNSYWSREIELVALEKQELSAALSESEKDFLTLSSRPEGADVYMGARWAGTTPLSLPRYKERSVWVSLRYDGYHEKSFEISPESPDSMEIVMEEEEMTRLEHFDLKKNEFYRSLGRFSLSVAAPVITAGVYSNYISRQNVYASEYLATNDTQYYDLANEMERNYYISYGVFWGTVGISSGLLVDVFVKLSRYIKAAEALAE